MKTKISIIIHFVLRRLHLFLLISFMSALPLRAQTFYLKDIVMGNRYDPNNVSFSYKTPWYYDWSIENPKVDSRGGYLELHVVVKSKPDCKKVYKVNWTFSKDISTVTCGEKIFIDVINQPISGGNCWDWVDINPSSLSLKNGASGMTWVETSKDPKVSYREYVFLHHPGHIIQGEPQFTNQQNYHLHQALQLEMIVCSRPDMAKEANGGNFHFNFDGRGIYFDIEYVFSKDPPVSSLGTSTTTSLQNPVIQHNIQNAEGTYWMSIQVPGTLQGYAGKQIQMVIRFVDANGNFLTGNRNDLRYVDSAGFAATGSGLVSVSAEQFDLSTLQFWMPYYSLNLPSTGGTKAYDLTAFAELFVDGKLVAQSLRVPLRVTW